LKKNKKVLRSITTTEAAPRKTKKEKFFFQFPFYQKKKGNIKK